MTTAYLIIELETILATTPVHAAVCRPLPRDTVVRITQELRDKHRLEQWLSGELERAIVKLEKAVKL